jgi:flagellin-specific chaperone FliS
MVCIFRPFYISVKNNITVIYDAIAISCKKYNRRMKQNPLDRSNKTIKKSTKLIGAVDVVESNFCLFVANLPF